MKTRLKKIFTAGLALLMVITIQTNSMSVNASVIYNANQSPMSIISKCNRCKKNNISYGRRSSYSGGTISANAGKVCKGCERVVKKGKIHITFYTVDRYMFSCSCGHDWHQDGDLIIIEHTIKDI